MHVVRIVHTFVSVSSSLTCSPPAKLAEVAELATTTFSQPRLRTSGLRTQQVLKLRSRLADLSSSHSLGHSPLERQLLLLEVFG
jgi:hypothetical protein